MANKYKTLKEFNKGPFTIQCGIFLFLVLMGLFILVLFMLKSNKPPEDTLVYEKCTFIKYESVKYESSHSTGYRYHIYVKEYDKPLEIFDIVYDKVLETDLSELNSGDKITVSIFEGKDEIELCSLSCAGDYILLYSDYVTAYKENLRMAFITTLFISGGSLVAFVIGAFYYKKTGRCL